MGKKLLVLIIILVIIVPVGVIGADLALSISSYDPSKFDASVGTPSVDLSADNTSINFNVNITITTPQLGFLPKAIIINLRVYEGTTLIGDPFSETITLGATQTKIITGAIILEDVYQIIINGGTSVTFTVKGVIKITIFGIIIPGIEFDIPDQSFVVP